MIRIAPEGFPFIGMFFILTVAAALAMGPGWTAIPFVLTLFMLYFFRDPDRAVPEAGGFLSPADGKVIAINNEYEAEFLKCETLKISIFMSPFNVHVNRAPCDAKVLDVRHRPGSFRAAYREEASGMNESTAMLLECLDGPVLVRQVAGFLARRTVCRVGPGESLKRGQRFGMIKFSSRLDVYLPRDSETRVGINDAVRAGETVLAGKAGGG
jgi:phosphatidylserine decarboxylase